MRRSKLEEYLDILNVLTCGKHLKITHIMQKANMSFVPLKECLEYLISQGLAEKRMIMEHHTFFEIFTITKKGTSAVACFKELNQTLPTIERQNSLQPLFMKVS